MSDCEFYTASEQYQDFILHYSPRSPEIVSNVFNNHCISIIDPEFAVVHIKADGAKPLSIARQAYGAIPKLYGLQDTTALEKSGILQAATQPSLRLTGRGVLIGMIDTGIDYINPLFRNTDGTTRIIRIWDQTLPSENPQPTPGFQPTYGSTFTSEQINEALMSDHPYELVPSKDDNGHGTFMAGVAAARRIEQPVSYSGAAPEAALAIVKLKPAKQYLRDFFLIREGVPAFQENDIMAAISYLLGLANEVKMPLVIYLGVGTSQGSHDGTSPLGQIIQNQSRYFGLAFVVGAGNEAGHQLHFSGNVPADQAYEDVELRVSEKETGFCLELWAEKPDLYTIGFVSPSGEIVERIPQALGKEISIPFRLDSTSITMNYVNFETASGSQLIFMRFRTPAPGIWHIRVYPSEAISRRYHMWLPMQQFLSGDTVFLRPDPDTTIVDPGNSGALLTVSTYNHVDNSIYIHSSRGFTRINTIKPDLAAPGVEVQGPLVTIPLPDSPPRLSENNPEIRFGRSTGSSVAAAIAAGAMAGLFTWAFTDKNDLNMSGSSAKALLLRGASRNPAFTYPSREWGYGTLDLFQVFLNIRE